MSLFDGQSLGAAAPSSTDPSTSQASQMETVVSAPSAEAKQTIETLNGVDPHREARAIVRLIQCSQCSLPLRNPLTLPCGQSLCRKCLPELHARPNISYPLLENRAEGFICPFKECGKDHPLGDCSQDVTLSKVMDRVGVEVARYRPITIDTPTLLDERPHWKNIVDSSKETRMASSRVLNGGRLLATFTLAEIGELRYDAEVAYQTMSPTGDTYEHLDVAMLSHLKEVTKSELDCQLCYGLLLDPLTTTCGHTYCRKCVARMLDHSHLCPICRRSLFMPPGVRNLPGNVRLSKLLDGLCPDLVSARTEAAKAEEIAMNGERNVPLFICTLAYPSMPTFLHIFEPRYRLMMRRAIETGDRKFGMLMYNMRREPQGDLGRTDFMKYGTLLHINNIQMMPDGRSLLETVGVSRFAVKDWTVQDGYVVGNVQKVDDIPIAEEESIEANETTQPPSATNSVTDQIDRMSTQELLRIGIDFIAQMRAASASWLHARVLASYGNPPEDPALFPYWFASVLPFQDEEKYKLLPTASVRERLKITAGWIKQIEASTWPPVAQWLPVDEDDDDDDDDEDESGSFHIEGPENRYEEVMDGDASDNAAAVTSTSNDETTQTTPTTTNAHADSSPPRRVEEAARDSEMTEPESEAENAF